MSVDDHSSMGCRAIIQATKAAGSVIIPMTCIYMYII